MKAHFHQTITLVEQNCFGEYAVFGVDSTENKHIKKQPQSPISYQL